MTRYLAKAKELVQELDEHKKELKSAVFDNRIALLNAFPSSIGDAMPLLGELTFANVQVPFDWLEVDCTVEFKPLDIRARYDFLLPLDDGQRIVAFKQFLLESDDEKCFTQMSCFDQLGRLVATGELEHHVQLENVAQCGPSEFVVFHESNASGSPKLSVYASADLKCLRTSACNNYFSNTCCNSKFVFGLCDSFELDSGKDDDDDSDDDTTERSKYCSRQRIRVHHLDTLSEAFALLVPKKYKIERLLADEHHLVAVCRMGDKTRQWYMTVFDLATCDEILSRSGDKTGHFCPPESLVDLDMEWLWQEELFLLDGWLVVPSAEEILWFDKRGNRSETSTYVDTSDLHTIYASRSALLFHFHDGKLLMKRICQDDNTSYRSL